MNDTFRLLRPYLRGLPIIVLVMIISMLAAKKYLSYVTPMYESTVKIKLADIHEGVPNSNLFKDLDVFSTSNKIAAEIELLKSQVLVNKVLDELHFYTQIKRVGKMRSVELYHNSPILISELHIDEKMRDKVFNLVVLNKEEFQLSLPGHKDFISGHFNDSLHVEDCDLVISLNDSLIATNPSLQIADHYSFEFLSQQKMLGIAGKALDITSIDKDVAILRISYKDANPEKAAAFTNKLAEEYINDYIETKYKAANITVNFLDDQIESTIQKLTNAEDQIQSYRDVESITNITQETETELRKISQLKIQQTNLKMSLEAIQELDAYIQKGKGQFLELAPNFEAFTDLLSTEIVKNIKTLQAEKKDLLLTFTPNDERVKVVDAKINDYTSYLVESIKNTRKNLEVKYNNLNDDIITAEAFFIGVPEKEKLLHILNREFNIYESSYNFLNEKKIEAEIAQAAKVAFHRIIASAQPSKEPVSPNRAIITIVATMLGMFGALFLIFLVHAIKGKVNDTATIESSCGIPVMILTPKLKTNQAITKHFLKEANLLDVKGFLVQENVVCLTSYRKIEGAYFNALHLAHAMALQGRKTILIDAEGQLKLKYNSNLDPIQVSENLSAVTLKNIGYDRMTQQVLQELIHGFASTVDIVILLNESIENDSVSTAFMSLAQLNLVVMDSRLTPKKRIVETELMAAEFKLPEVNFLLNRSQYNPSVIKEAIQLAKTIYTKVYSKLKKK
jgi:uncharacterized protein involved in exopolysaccharide biosynthesis